MTDRQEHRVFGDRECGVADKRAQEVATQAHGATQTTAWWDAYWRVMTEAGFPPLRPRPRNIPGERLIGEQEGSENV